MSKTPPDRLIDNDYWQGKWATGDTLFNQAVPNSFLEKHFPTLVPKPTKVFVPLCGKSVDMKWLLDRGHQVVGVELNEPACESFFRESRLDLTRRETTDFVVFSSKNCTLFCGDFFKITREHLGGAAIAYDRAALVALPPDIRSSYFEKLIELLGAGKRVFLLTFEYPQNEVAPPPFSIDEKEVRLLAKTFSMISIVENRPIDPAKLKNPKFQSASSYAEKAYWLV